MIMEELHQPARAWWRPLIGYDRMRRSSKLALIRISNRNLWLTAITRMNEAFPDSDRLTETINRLEYTILLNSQEELMYFKLIIGDLAQQLGLE